MLNINLLPWREIAAHKQRQQFKRHIYLTIGLGFALIALGHILLEHSITNYQKQQKKLEQQLALLQPQVTACEQLKKYQAALMQLLQTEQKSPESASFMRLLQDLGRLTATITLMQLQKNNHEILLQGISASTAMLTQFNQKLAQTSYLAAPPALIPSEHSFTIKLQLK